MSIVEFLSQPLWQRLGLTLVHFLWQGLAVAVLVGVLVRVFRLNHGNARYAAYLLAFIAMMVCPVVTFTAIDIPISPNSGLVRGAEFAEVVDSSSYTALSAGDILPEAETSSPVIPTLADSIPLGQRISGWLNVSMPWVLVIWMVGVVVLSVRLLMGFVGVYRWRHHLEPLAERLAQRIASLSERLGMRGFSRVFISPTVLQAMAVGYLRPMVLLPAVMVTQMQPEMLEGVIAHELAHIRRLDLWVNLAQRVTETLLFYHPAVWWLSNCLRSERELCCDELAVKATGERITYASTLESIGRSRFMAKQPVLAAGLGQDNKPTLSRVRHILGLTPTQRNCPFWLAGVITVLFLAGLVIPTTLALTNQSDEKLKDLESVVVEGIRANRDKFECGYLAWSRMHVNPGYEDPRGKQSGQYELWWDGKKMATKYVREEVHKDPEGNFRIEKQQGGDSYDGGVLSRKPAFRDDNWLGPQITRWSGPGSQDWLIRQDSKHKGISKDWSVVDNNGVKLIRAITKNTNETDRDYGGYSIIDYDPSKGYGLVNEEWYNPSSSPRLKHTVTMLEVIPGGWFPVEVDFKSFAITDGKVYSHNHCALDIERCNFNDKSALPASVFKGAVDKQLKYQEKLQSYLAMELEGISDVKEAAKADKVKLGAREAVEKFVAAALAGDFEKARQLADPNKAVADQVADMPEILQGQNLWIMAVVADDFDAIAVSSVIRGDHDRIGPLVFFLDRKPQDGRDNWWVDDIDLETPDGAEVGLKRFLEEHPEAKKVPSENKPAVQVEGENRIEKLDIETLLSKVRKALQPTENMRVSWEYETVEPFGVGTTECPHTVREYIATISGFKSRLEYLQKTYTSKASEDPYDIRRVTYVFDGKQCRNLEERIKGVKTTALGWEKPENVTVVLLYQELFACILPLDNKDKLNEYKLNLVDSPSPGIYVIKVLGPEDEIPYQITIDGSRGFNIIKTQWFGPKNTKTLEDTTVLRQYDDGIWYPAERRRIRYYPNGTHKLEHTQKFSKLELDVKVPEETFKLEFPPGTKTWDTTLEDWVIISDTDTFGAKQ